MPDICDTCGFPFNECCCQCCEYCGETYYQGLPNCYCDEEPDFGENCIRCGLDPSKCGCWIHRNE